jgi:hypothetical protein
VAVNLPELLSPIVGHLIAGYPNQPRFGQRLADYSVVGFNAGHCQHQVMQKVLSVIWLNPVPEPFGYLIE